MLGIDHQHGRFGSDKPGADPGVSGRRRRGSFHRTAARRSVRMDGTDAGTASVPELEQARKRAGAPVCSAHDRAEPGAGNPADFELRRHRTSEGRTVSPQNVRKTLHQGGCRPAGLCGQESRQPERPGDKANTGARARRIRPSRVRALGGHFRCAALPFPQLRRLSAKRTPATNRRGPRPFRSANGASRARGAGRAISASTPYTRATGTASKASITSMRSTK